MLVGSPVLRVVPARKMWALRVVQSRYSQPVSASTGCLFAWRVVVRKREGSPGFARCPGEEDVRN